MEELAKYKPCNCELCRHSYKRIGYKKYRKWNARYTSYLRKQLRKLKCMGIRRGTLDSENPLEVEYACVQDTLSASIVVYTEARLDKKWKWPKQ